MPFTQLAGRVRLKLIRLPLIVAAIYIVAAKFGLTMAFTAEQVTLVWPPTGLSLAAILLLGTDVWPGIFAGALIANITTHEPFGVAFAIAAGNTLEALAAASLIQWYAGARMS